MNNWLSEKHLASFVNDVAGELDLSKIYAVYEKGDGKGSPPCHPMPLNQAQKQEMDHLVEDIVDENTSGQGGPPMKFTTMHQTPLWSGR